MLLLLLLAIVIGCLVNFVEVELLERTMVADGAFWQIEVRLRVLRIGQRQMVAARLQQLTLLLADGFEQRIDALQLVVASLKDARNATTSCEF